MFRNTMGEVLNIDYCEVQEDLLRNLDNNLTEEIIVIERDDVEFRVIDSEAQNLESKVAESDDSLDQLVSSGSTMTGENPLDVQSRYVSSSESSTPYFSYNSTYESGENHDNITLTVQSESQRVRSISSEIVHKKVQAIAGGSHAQTYSNEHQQAQMEWYKRVNTFFLMFMYDVT